MIPDNDLRLGIIGLGNMGRVHAQMIRDGKVPGLRLTAVADQDPARLEAFGDLKRFDSGEALIASQEVDAVLVATPHYSHTPLGIAVLEAGLHLLVEKPISVHKEDCEKLIAAHRPDSGLVFAAMFNQRTDPFYRKLREMLRSGALGEVRRIQWTITNWFRSECYYQSGSWRATWAARVGESCSTIHSVELANAMLLSSFRDQPVRLPLDTAEYAQELKKRVATSTVAKKTAAGPEVASNFAASF